MGMYSYFNEEEIEVKDKRGLKSFLEDWEKANPDWWLNGKMIEGDVEEQNISFQNWDSMKLISYWYSIDTVFLKLVAKYIEGTVSWDFENNDESGNIRFEDGKCIIVCGIMQYSDHTPEDLAGEGVSHLNEGTKRLMICSNL